MNHPWKSRLTSCCLLLATFGCKPSSRPSKASTDPHQPLKAELLRFDTKSLDKLTQKQQSIFRLAQQDINLINSGNTPANCKPSVLLLDGGTQIFDSQYYEITKWKRLINVNGVTCLKRGISIKFKSSFPGVYPPGDLAADTWLEPVNQ